jgi:hypothetical protein
VTRENTKSILWMIESWSSEAEPPTGRRTQRGARPRPLWLHDCNPLHCIGRGADGCIGRNWHAEFGVRLLSSSTAIDRRKQAADDTR